MADEAPIPTPGPDPEPTPRPSPPQPATATVDGRIAPLATLARVLTVLIGVTVVLDAGAVLSDLAQLSLLGSAADGDTITQAQADEYDARQALIGISQFLLFLTTAVVWLGWFRRAYTNLPALVALRPRFGSTYVVGVWFIPFVNLVRPKQITDDLWRSGDPHAPSTPRLTPWTDLPVPALLAWWWAVWLAAGFVGWPAGATLAADDLSTIILGSRILLVSDALYVVADVLALLVVTRITARQQARAATLRDQAGQGFPAL